MTASRQAEATTGANGSELVAKANESQKIENGGSMEAGWAAGWGERQAAGEDWKRNAEDEWTEITEEENEGMK